MCIGGDHPHSVCTVAVISEERRTRVASAAQDQLTRVSSLWIHKLRAPHIRSHTDFEWGHISASCVQRRLSQSGEATTGEKKQAEESRECARADIKANGGCLEESKKSQTCFVLFWPKFIGLMPAVRTYNINNHGTKEGPLKEKVYP